MVATEMPWTETNASESSAVVAIEPRVASSQPPPAAAQRAAAAPPRLATSERAIGFAQQSMT